jgi:signal peptidase II
MSRRTERRTVRRVMRDGAVSPGPEATYWAFVVAVLLIDQVTKAAAVALLTPAAPINIVGGGVRLLLVYNDQGALSVSIGSHARLVLGLLTGVWLAVLRRAAKHARFRNRTCAVALGAMSGGTAGNLIDRVCSSRGVVDFIDIGVGSVRCWTFNVADLALCVGACLLLAQMG